MTYAYSNPAGLALLVRGPELPSRLQSIVPDVPVACAGSAGELAKLLRDPRWRAVAVEVDALGDAADELVGRLAALFPDVPVIAIGRPTDERRVAGLLASGRVRRFLRQPLAVARTRECVMTLLRPARAANAATAARAVATRWRRRGSWIAGGVAACAIASGGWWIAGDLASASHGGAVAADDAPALHGVRGAAGRDAASVAGGAANAVGAGADRAPADRAPSPAPAAAPDIGPLLAAGADARARGALVAPDGDNAAFYYRRALVLAPSDPRPREALEKLGATLLAAAEDALARRRLGEAEGRLAAASQVLGDDRVVDVRERLSTAREREEARRRAWASAAREWARAAEPRTVAEGPGPNAP